MSKALRTPPISAAALVFALSLSVAHGQDSKPQDVDFSALPEGKIAESCIPNEDYAVALIRERDAAFGEELAEMLKSTASLRERVAYLLRRFTEREGLIDEAELGYRDGVRKEEEVKRNIDIRSFLVAMATHCGWKYQEYLRDNFDDANFKKHRDSFVAAFDGYVTAHQQHRTDRRMKLGLPPEQGTATPPKN